MKKAILEILDFCRYKVVNDKCTPEELKSFYDIATKELDIRGSVSDLAEFYGQSRSNVSNVISRRYIPGKEKPKRQVTYRFGWFASIMPESWKRNR